MWILLQDGSMFKFSKAVFIEVEKYNEGGVLLFLNEEHRVIKSCTYPTVEEAETQQDKLRQKMADKGVLVTAE